MFTIMNVHQCPHQANQLMASRYARRLMSAAQAAFVPSARAVFMPDGKQRTGLGNLVRRGLHRLQSPEVMRTPPRDECP